MNKGCMCNFLELSLFARGYIYVKTNILKTVEHQTNIVLIKDCQKVVIGRIEICIKAMIDQ